MDQNTLGAVCHQVSTDIPAEDLVFPSAHRDVVHSNRAEVVQDIDCRVECPHQYQRVDLSQGLADDPQAWPGREEHQDHHQDVRAEDPDDRGLMREAGESDERGEHDVGEQQALDGSQSHPCSRYQVAVISSPAASVCEGRQSVS